MDLIELEHLIEAALLTSDEAITEDSLRQLSPETLDDNTLQTLLGYLQQRWQSRAVELVKTPHGWRFVLQQTAFEKLSSAGKLQPFRYSRAVMETLAIIAYRQPVTRGDIEAIRGVGVSSFVMQQLQERSWIEVVGQRDVIGKPNLWATTAAFLRDFQLESLEQLPDIAPPEALPSALSETINQAPIDFLSRDANEGIRP